MKKLIAITEYRFKNCSFPLAQICSTQDFKKERKTLLLNSSHLLLLSLLLRNGSLSSTLHNWLHFNIQCLMTGM
jgi:hypothetical protein